MSSPRVVDTLYVLSSLGSGYAIQDQIASIRWASNGGTYHIVAVDEAGGELARWRLSETDDLSVLTSRGVGAAPSGFHRSHGLRGALSCGVVFQQAVLLSDTCLIIGQGLDAFGLGQLKGSGAALLGVCNRRDLSHSYRLALPYLYDWKIPHDAWENPPPAVCDDILFLSYAAAIELKRRDLLVPADCRTWPEHYGVYLSWVVQMLGLPMLMWGGDDKTLPPLYVGPAGGHLPPPHILAARFIAYSSSRGVLAYSEGDLRELYKRLRGEPAREIPPYGPVMAPPPGQPL